MSFTEDELKGIGIIAKESLSAFSDPLKQLMALATKSPLHGALVFSVLSGFAEDICSLTVQASNLTVDEIDQVDEYLRKEQVVRVVVGQVDPTTDVMFRSKGGSA